ncbi:hypothetical protein [Paraburkholderia heleia]|uniref:hypothetical protein n=1 Tax=Paraburkholderia heleia TaxID=634127 RepID=UPI002AB63C7D|nr:hypothetical protein [Paraburkholderia heleia]
MLVEQKLVTEEGLDSAPRVMVHSAQKEGRELQVFYTAVPVKKANDLLRWCREQREAVLASHVMAAIWRSLDSQDALITQVDRKLVFVAKCRRQVLCASTVAFNGTQDDVFAALEVLIERASALLDTHLSTGERAALTGRWVPVLGVRDAAWSMADEAGKAQTVFERLRVRHVPACVQITRDGAHGLVSALAQLNTVSVRGADGGAIERLNWASAAYAAVWARGTCVLAVGVLMAAGVSLVRVSRLDSDAARATARAAVIEGQAASIEAVASVPTGYGELATQVGALVQAVSEMDLVRTVSDIGHASRASGVRVMGLHTVQTQGQRDGKKDGARSAARDGPTRGSAVPRGAAKEGVGSSHLRVEIECALTAQGDAGTQSLSRFVQELRLAGYRVEPDETLHRRSPTAGTWQSIAYLVDAPAKDIGDGVTEDVREP